MTVKDVDQMIKRAAAKYKLIVELVDSVVWSDTFSAAGKGVADHDLAADLAGQFGVYSLPPDGGDAVFLKLGAEGNSSICIGYRHRSFEVKIAKGEVLIRDDQGQQVYVKRDGIYIEGAKVIINNGTVAAARVGDTSSASTALAAWALVVETFVNGIVAGTFTPANQFSGVNPANPGKAGNLSAIATGSGDVKIG